MEENNNIEENNKQELNENIEIQESVEQEDDKKNNILMIVLLAILFIAMISYAVLSKFIPKEENISKEVEKVEEKEEIKKDDDDELLYTLNVYKSSAGEICGEYNKDWCKDLAFTIKTKTEKAKVISGYNAYVLYEDDGLKVYNNYNGKITKLELDDQYKRYELHIVDDKLLGILYYNESENYCKYDLSGYYNINTKEKMYDNKYLYLSTLYNSNYLTAVSHGKIELLNASEEKEEIVEKQTYNVNDNICYIMLRNQFNIYSYDNKNFFYITDGDMFNAYKFYSNDKKVIFDKQVNEGKWSFKDKYLYVVDDNVVKKYDIDGTEMSKSKTFNDIKGVITNYLVYVENNNLSLMNIDNDKSIVLDKWNENNYFDTWQISGYYTRERLDEMGEKDKPEGVYVVIYYKKPDSNGNYGIEYCYTKTGEIKTFDVKTQQGGRAKPVLYLYPTKTTNVKVEFAHPEYLTTTYPKYNKSWNVIAKPNGDLYDKNNKYYYALYWDEIRYNEVDFHEGFYVESKDAINFLEEKLDYIGLNSKERNEFIMYWLPILENNKQSLVYFELTKEREIGNKLIINPIPDSMLRLSIHIKKVDNYVNIKEQKLEKFKRFGFSVVEWGGMIY